MTSSPLLSIAIPAYNRSDELLLSLNRFVDQITAGALESEVEILITDDASPVDSLREVRALSARHPFVTYRRNETNIGLERNLLHCANGCAGEYLWIFGDDDYLEIDHALPFVLRLLKTERYDFVVLNRTRRNGDLSHLLTANWMRLDENSAYEYRGLREFCLDHGFISAIGFVSVSIFRRSTYIQVEASKYLGTMYPQLGAMFEAFHDRSTLLVGKPVVCHRTLTQEEKREELRHKVGEADFMSDASVRNATYFGHPFVDMLNTLMRCGAWDATSLMRVRENTVIDGLLIDFLMDSVRLSHELGLPISPETWRRTAMFFRSLPLDQERRQAMEGLLAACCPDLSAG